MSSTFSDLRSRLEAAQKALSLTGGQLAAELKITPEWLSKIMRGHAKGSDDIRLRLDDLLRRRGIELDSTTSTGFVLTARHQNPGAESSDALRLEARRLFDHIIAASGDDPVRLSWVVEQLRIHLRKPATWPEPETPEQIAARLNLPTMGKASQHLRPEMERSQPTLPPRKSAQQ